MSLTPNPLFGVKTHTLTLEKVWEHFEACLKAHDWTYEYSDDFRYWSKGNDERTHINHTKKVLEKHDAPRAVALYAKYEIK